MTLAVALFTVSTGLGAPKIEETIVAPAWENGTIFTLSPKGMHLASMHTKGSRFVVTVDGVDGEPFDQIQNAAFGTWVKPTPDGLETSGSWVGPVAFSPDGTRHAYAARRGQEVLVILDGKEIFRGPSSLTVAAAINLQFSPDGNHVFFFNQTADTAQSYRLMMDGKPVTPAFSGMQYPFFVRDGARWGLLAGKPRSPNEKFLIIDGKDAGYVGEFPQFTPDEKHVVAIGGALPKQSVLVDGNPLVTGQSVGKFIISPNGDIGSIVGIDGRTHLFINDKRVAENVGNVHFSPDGKHWAASCGLNGVAWMVVDGKKQRDYKAVRLVQFSPDSSKCVHVAERDGKTFVVVNGQENAGHTLLHHPPVFSETGNGVIYIAGEMMGKLSVHHNDHVEPINHRLAAHTISPDGKRFAYHSTGMTVTARPVLIVDGVENGPAGGRPLYSPDSKHLVASAFQKLWVDGETISSPLTPIGFTNNSQHLILSGRETDANGMALDTYYVNGDLVAKFSSKGTQFAGNGRPQIWEEQPDGRIVFVGIAPAPNGYGPMKRITVTPAVKENLIAWVAALKDREMQAAAAVEAAKKKTADDAAGAIAKRKADLEAATAAKAKARSDAAAAAAAKKKK